MSILLNPAFFEAIEWLRPVLLRKAGASPAAPSLTLEPLAATTLTDHMIVIGYGRVGKTIVDDIKRRGLPVVVVEDNPETAAAAWPPVSRPSRETPRPRKSSTPPTRGMRARSSSPYPNGFEAGQIVSQTHEMKPSLRVVVRAHSDAEAEHLHHFGADHVIMGEREIALGMLDALFRS